MIEMCKTTVLGLAGTELIFFIVANTALWFRFLIKILLITHQCFGYFWIVSRPSLFLTLPRQQVGWGCHRRWEGTQLGQLTQT